MAPCCSRQISAWSRFITWLEEETFYSRGKFDEETNQWLARVKILTSSGIILHHCSYLNDCGVSDGDTLIVVLVPADPDFEGSAEQCF